ncbi:hypothetical protein [Aquimarina sp. RZ0]|uniref:hypothetical protein n=1 Tax=Aquimarina sp. RZ0 TaxID=2607730 RepID=UPI0011F17C04|nr:hypothetical protein [Aquimarina sp. RZ0]KAA1244122.1 hypothetical protein F0000_17740 [Aquimarina sp. RZ0]
MVKLENSPKPEMRLTHNNGKKYVLLFDTVTLENDTLKGERSRILHNLRREFLLDNSRKCNYNPVSGLSPRRALGASSQSPPGAWSLNQVLSDPQI